VADWRGTKACVGVGQGGGDEDLPRFVLRSPPGLSVAFVVACSVGMSVAALFAITALVGLGFVSSRSSCATCASTAATWPSTSNSATPAKSQMPALRKALIAAARTVPGRRQRQRQL
jgi:hypothetical protein